MTLPNKEQLIINFNRCINWEEKYLYLIELGEKIPQISNDLYSNKYIISGCHSQVWIKITPHHDNTFIFEGDSNSSIVKGLIAIIFIFYKNLSVNDIISLDIRYLFHKLELIRYITPTRSKGIEEIIIYILKVVKQYIIK
ncbi:MAG: cysteine desulfuration protein SufE [Pantoea sp. Brub]|nr:cysteine desulfuration protein SufE [Pantoea sp. Brub]